MRSSIQRVFRDHFERFSAEHPQRLDVHRAARAIMACRSAQLGGHIQACPDGHVQRVWYNSCKHRACPLCAHIQRERWIAQQQAKLLDCDYYHTIFTIDGSLNVLWEHNRQAVMKLLFRSAWGALKELLADPKYLGAEPGAIASFHSWGQTLWSHPHAHLLVTGGGLSPQGEWKSTRHGMLLPSRVLSAKFRGKLLALLGEAIAKDELVLPPERTRQQWLNLLNKLGRKKWHVMIMPPYAHGRGVIAYLARYVRGGPVSDRRVRYRDGRVTLTYKDNKAEGGTRRRSMELTPDQFLQRVCDHVPPPRVHSVRAYGLFAHAKRQSLNRARDLLGQLPVQPPETETWQDVCARSGHAHPEICPVCGKRLIRLEILPRAQSPPRPIRLPA